MCEFFKTDNLYLVKITRRYVTAVRKTGQGIKGKSAYVDQNQNLALTARGKRKHTARQLRSELEAATRAEYQGKRYTEDLMKKAFMPESQRCVLHLLHKK